MSKANVIEGPIEGSLLMADISGFTQLLDQASRDEKAPRRILKTTQGIFAKTGEESSELEGFAVINTTGDGFLALAGGKTSSRTARTELPARGVSYHASCLVIHPLRMRSSTAGQSIRSRSRFTSCPPRCLPSVAMSAFPTSTLRMATDHPRGGFLDGRWLRLPPFGLRGCPQRSGFQFTAEAIGSESGAVQFARDPLGR